MENGRPDYPGSSEADRPDPGTDSHGPTRFRVEATGVEEILAFDQLSIQDLEFLAIAAAKLRTGQTASQILMAIASGKGHLLRIIGLTKGIIAGQIIIHPGGKEFQMGVFAGEGIFPWRFRFLADAICQWAKAHDCRWVRFENIHPALDRYYKTKFDRESTVYVKEIKDGRE
jgi:hypothetical protein